MPYEWIKQPQANSTRSELHLWPYNALPPKGFAAMILGFFTFACFPMFALLGTAVFWGMLPFMLGALGALYWALTKNGRDRQILEILEIAPDLTRLTRHNPKGAPQEWESNTYWIKLALHPDQGPVPNYVTLKGNGREVEIGAFLSEDERKELYTDLDTRLRIALNG
ncbi:MAG: DUF2244 domain-containing protein [Pelagimonas sp.]|jgi:uncharacterized membrane protein|nr:DUF2244 domain-containing protein [Pelagimonas sp.]